MKHLLVVALLSALLQAAQAAPPLRVFIRGGVKTHGPNAHEHERFLHDWTKILTDRGLKASGAMDWPSPLQLAQTDVLAESDTGDGTPKIQPQMWTYEKDGYRAILLRGICWAGKPNNLDEFCKPEEIKALAQPGN